MRSARARLLQRHPGYEHLLFTDSDIRAFVAREYPEYGELFSGLGGDIRLIDLFRYLAISRVGGFYADLDVWFSGSVDDLLDERVVFPFELQMPGDHFLGRYPSRMLIGQYAFGAEAGNQFVDLLVKACVSAIRSPDSFPVPLRHGDPDWNRVKRVLYGTGPGMVTRVFHEHPELQSSLRILYAGAADDPRTWSRFGRYAYHAGQGSWHSRPESWLTVSLQDLKRVIHWRIRNRPD